MALYVSVRQDQQEIQVPHYVAGKVIIVETIDEARSIVLAAYPEAAFSSGWRKNGEPFSKPLGYVPPASEWSHAHLSVWASQQIREWDVDGMAVCAMIVNGSEFAPEPNARFLAD